MTKVLYLDWMYTAGVPVRVEIHPETICIILWDGFSQLTQSPSAFYTLLQAHAPKSVENSSASLSLECSNCISIWTVPPGVCILAQATLPLRDCGSGGRDQTQTQRPNCLSSPAQVHIECGKSGEVQCQNDTEELIFSHGENYMNILKRKTHMEVFVKHLALWRLLGRGLHKFEEKISSSGMGLFRSVYLTLNVIKSVEHKLSVLKLDLQLSDSKFIFMCMMLWQFFMYLLIQSWLCFLPIPQFWWDDQ